MLEQKIATFSIISNSRILMGCKCSGLKLKVIKRNFPMWLKGTLVWLNWARRLLAKESLKCDSSLWFSLKYHFLLHLYEFLRDLWMCFSSYRKAIQNSWMDEANGAELVMRLWSIPHPSGTLPHRCISASLSTNLRKLLPGPWFHFATALFTPLV